MMDRSGIIWHSAKKVTFAALAKISKIFEKKIAKDSVQRLIRVLYGTTWIPKLVFFYHVRIYQ